MRPLRPWRILVAEDNPDVQHLLVRMLEQHGHTVVLAGTGLEAVAAVEREPFDVVLMDVQMPEMGGLDATREIRRQEAGGQRSNRRNLAGHTGWHLPIIALTAHAMVGDRERCLAAGMDAYISKPIHLAALLDEIERLVAPEATAEARCA